ncbi:MAG: serine hydrolase [Eubacterium sp.]|nr:serine hydrolase [Eubacterium sp.]
MRQNRKKKAFLRILSLLTVICFLITGCGKNPFTLEKTYEEYYQESQKEEDSGLEGMAANLAVLPAEEQNTSGYYSNDYADLLINDTANEVIESYRCFEKVYPASITKIMTALLTLEHGNLDDTITLEHDTVVAEDGAVISTLSKGDTVTVSQVFHTMMIKSANDCAVILAEYVAGSEEKFIDMMNERAKELGATHTHFANTNGLHSPEHFTTAYDLYLIFKEAVKHETFVDTVSMKDFTMTYVNAQGHEVKEYMESTNYYLLNNYPIPTGVVMYGGKTGTTSMAKSCLILMTENDDGERFFSVVLGAKTKEDLYHSMTDLLEKTVN